MATAQQSVTISGKVIDEFGDGLPGATVTFPGTGIGITTELDGTYTIKTDTSSMTTTRRKRKEGRRRGKKNKKIKDDEEETHEEGKEKKRKHNMMQH